MLLKFARAVRTKNLKAVELLANLQSTVNVLSEQTGMVATEDVQERMTVVYPIPKVRVSDPSYR